MADRFDVIGSAGCSIGSPISILARGSGEGTWGVADRVAGPEGLPELEGLVDCDLVSDRKATFADNSE